MVKTANDLFDSVLASQDAVKLGILQMQKVIKEKDEEIQNLKKQVRDLEAKFKNREEDHPISPSLRNTIDSNAISKDVPKGPSVIDKLFSKNVPHILEMIFLSLNYKSYKACLEVNSSWRELLTSEPYQRKGKDLFNYDIQFDEYRLLEDSRCGKTEEVRRLLSIGMLDVNYEITAEKAGPPLLEAARSGHTNVVKMLLDKGAKPDKFNDFGRSPLHWASNNNYVDVVQLLLDSDANPNLATTDENLTPLFFAAFWDSKDVVPILLDNGADPNKASSDGTTPLILAACFDHKDIIQLLLDGGADPNKADEEGATPLSEAFRRGHFDIVNILKAEGALT